MSPNPTKDFRIKPNPPTPFPGKEGGDGGRYDSPLPHSRAVLSAGPNPPEHGRSVTPSGTDLIAWGEEAIARAQKIAPHIAAKVQRLTGDTSLDQKQLDEASEQPPVA
jgi:hypothetical protein